MNHATICIFLNQLKHPHPNLFNSISHNINEKWWSQTKNESEITKRTKTLQVYVIKCNERKTEVRRVQTESMLVQWGCLHIPKLMVFTILG